MGECNCDEFSHRLSCPASRIKMPEGREATVECVRCGASVPWLYRMQVYDAATKTVTAPVCGVCFETRQSWRPVSPPARETTPPPSD